MTQAEAENLARELREFTDDCLAEELAGRKRIAANTKRLADLDPANAALAHLSNVDTYMVTLFEYEIARRKAA